MIDTFQRFAQGLRFLRIPSIVFGLVCLLSVAVSVLDGGSTEGHRYMMPGFIGLIWAIATFSFIETFSDIPAKAEKSDRLVARFKRRLRRAWFWLVALVFLFTSVSALVFTGRLVSIWLKDSVS